MALGIDIGQSHMRAVVYSQGKIVFQADSVSCFDEGTFGHLRSEVLENLLKGIPFPIASVGIGMSGYELGDFRVAVQAVIHKYFPHTEIVVASDAVTAHLGAFQGGDGLVVCAGTGVVGYGSLHGDQASVAGHGFLLGDYGGGVWIGLEALRRALLVIDGMGKQTDLVSIIPDYFHQRSLEDVRGLVRTNPQIAANLVPFVVYLNDSTSKDILDEAGYWLAKTMIGLCHKLKAHNQVKVALAGGISRIPRIVARYEEMLATGMPVPYTCLTPQTDSSMGAVILGAKGLSR